MVNRMTYREIEEYLSSSERLGIKFGLSNIRRLLKGIHFDYDSFKIIHVTGTNGKGSVCAFLASILKEAGFNVGLYTSPHLVDFRERIQVNGNWIPKAKVEAYFPRLLSLVKSGVDGVPLKPTYFELMTALAFDYFSRSRVDIAVIEVGMGGRLDATNVFNKSLVSIITNVSLEHTTYLGKRISDICWEKGGIIKRKGIVVTGVRQRRAQDVLREICRRKKARLFVLGEDIRSERVNGMNFFPIQKFDYEGLFSQYRDLKIRLLGHHQIENASLAVAAIEAMRLRGINVQEEHLRKGLEGASWPGRLELIPIPSAGGKDRLVLLDGAHNPAAMASLKESLLDGYIGHKGITLVLGILKDKDARKMVKQIVPLAKRVIVTSPQTERAMDKDLLRKEVLEYIPPREVGVAENVREALEKAIKISHPGEIVCVTGSLYTVGEARSILRK